MQLTAGTTLGPYEIVEKIGAGGMGAVYRARDSRLDRSVAIKVLPEEFAAHPKMRERLGREARAVSALSHPNICPLYDIGSSGGIDYLVMELIDGESLAQRLTRGPLPLPQALRYGAEIASALDAAHRAGVIHRDLKPGNVMLTKSGARLLDFGLAKQHEAAFESRDVTEQAPLTDPGVVVGTLQYMSPEQIEGQTLDARSDIFSFGAMLYEIVSGRRAFDGTSRSDVIAAIVREEPTPLRELTPTVPLAVDRVIRKCMEKDRDDRWQSARDLADELRFLGGSESGSTGVTPIPAARRKLVLLIVAAIAVLVAGGFALSRLRSTPAAATPSEIRFSINPPPGSSFTQRATNNEFAVSPDGTHIAFAAVHGGHRSLYVRSLNALNVRELDDTDGAMSPFWSPDSSMIGFFANGAMKKAPAGGGAIQTICKASGGTASWGTGGLILFAEWGPDVTSAIEIVPENGGTPKNVTDEKGWHFWPYFLDDGQHFLYRLIGESGATSGLFLASIDGSTKARNLLSGVSRAEATRDNWLYFVRDGVLTRQKFDPAKGVMLGQPSTLAQPVFSFLPTANANFSVDHIGRVVAYQRTPADVQLVWRDRDGHDLGHLAPIPRIRSYRISPNGRRIAVERFEAATGVSDIWMYDTSRDVLSRLTSEAYGCFTPIWTHDGNELVVAAVSRQHITDPPQLSVLNPADGKIRELMAGDGVEYPSDVLRDGSAAVYTANRGKQKTIELMSMSGDRKHRPLVSGEFNQSDGVISPDQRWIAFTSDESGRPEIYVSPFDHAGEKTRVSTEGGTEPSWSPAARELYYLGASGMLTRVAVNFNDATPIVNKPVAMFPVSSAFMLQLEEFRLPHYDVDPDGKRFLVRELASGRDDDPVTLIISAPPRD